MLRPDVPPAISKENEPMRIRALLLLLHMCITLNVCLPARAGDRMTGEASKTISLAAEGTRWTQGKIRIYLRIPQRLLAHSVAWSPESDRIATLDDWGNGINLWDASSGKRLFEVRKKAAIGYSVAFTRDGKFLLVQSLTSGQDDHETSFSLLDTRDGHLVRTINGSIPSKNNAALAFVLSSDGKHLALVTAGDIRHFQIYNTNSWKVDGVIAPPSAVRNVLALDGNGGLLAAADLEGSIVFCRAPSGGCSGALKAFPNEITSLAFSPDGGTLLAGILNARWGVSGEAMKSPALLDDADHHKVKQFDVAARAQVGAIDVDIPEARSLAVHPSGQIFAVGGAGAVWLFSMQGCKLLAQVANFSHVQSVAFSPDGRFLAVGSDQMLTIIGPDG